MSEVDSTNVPYGYCQCGCGQKTRVATKTNKWARQIEGEPLRFIHGHNHRTPITNTGPGYYKRYTVEDAGHNTPCWIWQGGLTTKGYACVGHDGRTQQVHRIHYKHKYGSIADGMQLDHLCRVRRCVNPEHLEEVDGITNHRRGDLAKITAEDAEHIRKLYATGYYTQVEIGKMYGLTNSGIWRIVHNKYWL